MENINKIIKSICKESPLSIEYIEQGLTNDNYLLTFQDRKEVLRIPKQGNHKLFDYELEYEILNKVKSINLDVDTLYYNVDSGIKLTKYIEDANHFSTEYIEEASLLIKKLHESKIHVGKQYDIEKMFKEYQDRNHEILFDTSFAHHYISKAKQLSKEQHVLCHNDLVEGNFLFTKDQSYLIDYEYAMDNHPYFDLMSFITENDIQNSQDRERIYKIYFGDDFESIDYEALKIFEIAHHVLWCEWASFMYMQHQEKIYYEIAELKYKRLMECFQ